MTTTKKYDLGRINIDSDKEETAPKKTKRNKRRTKSKDNPENEIKDLIMVNVEPLTPEQPDNKEEYELSQIVGQDQTYLNNVHDIPTLQ